MWESTTHLEQLLRKGSELDAAANSDVLLIVKRDILESREVDGKSSIGTTEAEIAVRVTTTTRRDLDAEFTSAGHGLGHVLRRGGLDNDGWIPRQTRVEGQVLQQIVVL